MTDSDLSQMFNELKRELSRKPNTWTLFVYAALLGFVIIMATR